MTSLPCVPHDINFTNFRYRLSNNTEGNRTSVGRSHKQNSNQLTRTQVFLQVRTGAWNRRCVKPDVEILRPPADGFRVSAAAAAAPGNARFYGGWDSPALPIETRKIFADCHRQGEIYIAPSFIWWQYLLDYIQGFVC